MSVTGTVSNSVASLLYTLTIYLYPLPILIAKATIHLHIVGVKLLTVDYLLLFLMGQPPVHQWKWITIRPDIVQVVDHSQPTADSNMTVVVW